jgi:outer membrane protein assembly factor BamD (BamD/ComL family)
MQRSIVIVLLAMLVMGCSNPKKQMINKVTQQETEMKKGFNKKNADELIISYNGYIEKYPTDSTSRLYMAKGAELSILNNDPQNALKFIDSFLKNFPNDPKAPLMQFKKGMVYDLLLHDELRAIAEYDIFIKKYPADPMRIEAENAILLIRNPETFMATYGADTDTTSKQPQNQ